MGIQHAKAFFIESENGNRCEFIVGSARWTTSTRANGELCVLGMGHGPDVTLIKRWFVFSIYQAIGSVVGGAPCSPIESGYREWHRKAQGL